MNFFPLMNNNEIAKERINKRPISQITHLNNICISFLTFYTCHSHNKRSTGLDCHLTTIALKLSCQGVQCLHFKLILKSKPWSETLWLLPLLLLFQVCKNQFIFIKEGQDSENLGLSTVSGKKYSGKMADGVSELLLFKT